MAVDVRRPHRRSKADARRLVDEMAEDLAAKLKLTRQWESGPGAADRLAFRGTGVSGYIDVDDAEVHVHVERSFFLPVSERKIRTRVEEHMDEHLARPDAPPASGPSALTDDRPDSVSTGDTAASGEADESARAASEPPPGPHARGGPPPLVGLAVSAFRIAARSGQVPADVLEALLLSPGQLGRLPDEQQRRMQEMGAHLRALRQQAGLSLRELSEAINLSDPSFLRAVEAGRATLSRDLVMRLSAALARQPADLARRLARAYGIR